VEHVVLLRRHCGAATAPSENPGGAMGSNLVGMALCLAVVALFYVFVLGN